MTDPDGRRTTEPFFEVRTPPATVHRRLSAPWPVRPNPGFAFTPEPLLQQWLRKLRQLIQKRYQTR